MDDISKLLSQSLNFLQALIDAIPNPVFYKNKRGEYLGVNVAFLECFGLTRNLVLGKTVFDIFPKEVADVYHAQDMELLEHPGLRVFDGIVHHVRLGRRHVKDNRATFSGEDGKIAGIIGIVVDITEHKESQEELLRFVKAMEGSRDYLDKIINSIHDPIFVKDRQHRLVLVNDAECLLAGVSRQELIGKTDYDFFPKEQVDVFWAKDELVFKTGEENINEELLTDAQGNNRVVVTRKALYVDVSGNKFIVGIIRDITDRKTMERQLQEKLAELEKFTTVIVEREQKLIELKAEVNCLLEKLKQRPYYPAGCINAATRDRVSKMLEDHQIP
jgi:PAS domain S-box-containing protein